MNETPEEVIALAQRYLGERGANHGEGTEFTMDELDVIRNYVRDKFQDDYIVLAAFTGTEREFSKGHRCSVCGMTGKQAKAANYNCREEC